MFVVEVVRLEGSSPPAIRVHLSSPSPNPNMLISRKLHERTQHNTTPGPPWAHRLRARATTHTVAPRAAFGWESGASLRTLGGGGMLRPRAAAAARNHPVEPIIRTVGFCVPGDAASEPSGGGGGGGGGGGVAPPGGSNAPRHQPGSPSPVIIPPALIRVRLRLHRPPRSPTLHDKAISCSVLSPTQGHCRSGVL